MSEPSPTDIPPVVIEESARAQVRAHIGEDNRIELGGVLAGRVDATGVRVVAAVPARTAAGTARSFTFTQPAWTEVNEALAAAHPDLVPVGWYHSHPDLGIHLSDHDRFISSTFFPEPWQVAYVIDPVRNESGIYARGGTQLVSSQKAAEPSATASAGAVAPPAGGAGHAPGRRPDRRLVIAGAAVLGALILFLLGYAAHGSSPGDRLSYTTTYDDGHLSMTAIVTQHGANADLTETFKEVGAKRTLQGTLSPCLPSGAFLGSYKNLQVVAPDNCLLDLTASHPTASITGSGPAATVLATVGPTTFRAASSHK